MHHHPIVTHVQWINLWRSGSFSFFPSFPLPSIYLFLPFSLCLFDDRLPPLFFFADLFSYLNFLVFIPLFTLLHLFFQAFFIISPISLISIPLCANTSSSCGTTIDPRDSTPWLEFLWLNHNFFQKAWVYVQWWKRFILIFRSRDWITASVIVVCILNHFPFIVH